MQCLDGKETHQMRTSIKLKHILADHSIDVSHDDGMFHVYVFPKNKEISGEELTHQLVTGKSWSEVIGKVYRMVMKGNEG